MHECSCMYKYIYVCINVCMYLDIFTCMHIYLGMYVGRYKWVYIHMWVHVFMHIFMYMCMQVYKFMLLSQYTSLTYVTEQIWPPHCKYGPQPLYLMYVDIYVCMYAYMSFIVLNIHTDLPFWHTCPICFMLLPCMCQQQIHPSNSTYANEFICR